MRVALLCLSLIAASPGPAYAAERPQAGLIWNRSGLPATLPLQIRSQRGIDHLVTLSDPETGDEVMAGYVRGGDFFRLLVPPGRWLVTFASGGADGWQGQDDLFGQTTQVIRTAEPLSFGAGVARRRGNVITLEMTDDHTRIADADAQVICQLGRWQAAPRPLSDEDDLVDGPFQDRRFIDRATRDRVRENVPELLFGSDPGTGRSGQAPRAAGGATGLRDVICAPGR